MVYNRRYMLVKNIALWLSLALLALALLAAAYDTCAADDFSLRLTVNGQDISETDTVVIDPAADLVIDFQVFGVTRDINLRNISVVVTFAGQVVMERAVSLGNYVIVPGESYRREIVINTGEALNLADRPLTTGVYRSQVRLEYIAEGQVRTLSLWKNFRIPGNPLNTPVGAAGVAVGAGTLASILLLVRSLAGTSLPVGATLPPGTPVETLPLLRKLAMDRLEPVTRGRLVGSVVSAARKRIVKEKCPICGSRLKHGHCFTCKKSAKEVNREYQNRLKDLALQGGQLIADGKVKTLDDLCAALNISGNLGSDVIATLKHARLVKVRGLARKIAGKAVMTGIGSGLSAIIWVTVGGLAVLSAPVLIGIVAASIIVPLAVTRGLQIKAGRELRKSTQ
jgi:hypothetical protein